MTKRTKRFSNVLEKRGYKTLKCHYSKTQKINIGETTLKKSRYEREVKT